REEIREIVPHAFVQIEAVGTLEALDVIRIPDELGARLERSDLFLASLELLGSGLPGLVVATRAQQQGAEHDGADCPADGDLHGFPPQGSPDSHKLNAGPS